jgi:hypothetical protein
VTVAAWPPVLGRKMFLLLDSADWIVTDLGRESAKTGFPAYLHGQFVPHIRLLRTRGGGNSGESPLEATLFSSVDVGYRSDTLRWEDPATLQEGLAARLASLTAPVRRISTAQQAREYFSAAALRQEAVFLSYSGDDQDYAAEISRLLKTKYKNVFDYRDGRSLSAGEPWLSSMLERLAKSAIAVPILSATYFASGYCKQEAEVMVSMRNQNKMLVIPIKVDRSLKQLPMFLHDIQYLRAWEYKSSTELVQRIEDTVEQAMRSVEATPT